MLKLNRRVKATIKQVKWDNRKQKHRFTFINGYSSPLIGGKFLVRFGRQLAVTQINTLGEKKIDRFVADIRRVQYGKGNESKVSYKGVSVEYDDLPQIITHLQSILTQWNQLVEVVRQKGLADETQGSKEFPADINPDNGAESGKGTTEELSGNHS